MSKKWYNLFHTEADHRHSSCLLYTKRHDLYRGRQECPCVPTAIRLRDVQDIVSSLRPAYNLRKVGANMCRSGILSPSTECSCSIGPDLYVICFVQVTYKFFNTLFTVPENPERFFICLNNGSGSSAPVFYPPTTAAPPNPVWRHRL